MRAHMLTEILGNSNLQLATPKLSSGKSLTGASVEIWMIRAGVVSIQVRTFAGTPGGDGDNTEEGLIKKNETDAELGAALADLTLDCLRVGVLSLVSIGV